MHEVALAEAILEAALRRAAGRRLRRVRVRVGALHRVTLPAMDQAFALAADGTVAQDARLELVVVPVVAACRACGYREEGEAPLPVCPRCGSPDLKLSGGDELLLESIEVERAPEGAGGGAHVSWDPG
ncbi:MAG TPA: hydrogenase maturation nickel metallochaperone HypA [Actinomycetota bacterium]|nr:hydrogenase maturation nickel metallochaperone HypA [Actinomycetota bacterium]